MSAPGQNPGGPLRVLRIGPAGGATTPTTTLTAPGERTRRASIAVDASAGWIAWATAGTGRRSIRVARAAGNGVYSAPRTVSGSEGVATTAPSIALTPRGRGILAWATLDGRIRAVTRAGR
ncbi:MAG: hypothetical protein M3P44_07225 [Actinomycetota bacterium]|nr:hypothetical protein [Actinomycetota bacterium]